ncbi:hypothetical protein C8R45DRAFT_928961 [Mycena sanguinolenta]|nr:hypothetical protein C8R45DRAFT_928961 [Mycena sanguinolenta]
MDSYCEVQTAWNNGSAAIGNATVNATGFNITCGYVNDVTQKFSLGGWQMQEGEGDTSVTYWISPTSRRVISSELNILFTQSVVLYSTISIVDSDNRLGASIKLSPPMNTSSLINQQAVVDTQSGHVISVEPDIRKTTSSWAPYSGPFDGPKDSDDFPLSMSSMSGNLFLDTWGVWYPWLPPTEIDTSHANFDLPSPFLNAGDAYLIQKLNLFLTDSGPPRPNVTLHELENALSDIVASMFWTLSRKPVGAPSSLNISTWGERAVAQRAAEMNTCSFFCSSTFLL